MVQGVSGKKILLVSFKDGCDKDLTLNIITFMIEDSITVTKEAKVLTISLIPDDTVDLEKGYYPGVYVLLHFNKDYGVDSK